jgi:hypothetical protein
MSKLIWSAGVVAELSQLLTQSNVQSSAEVGGVTVYHLNHEGQDKIAISLPQGKALFIATADGGRRLRRRRAEPKPTV